MSQRCVYDRYHNNLLRVCEWSLSRSSPASLKQTHSMCCAVKEDKIAVRLLVVDEATQMTNEHSVLALIDEVVRPEVTGRVFVTGTLPSPSKQLMLSGHSLATSATLEDQKLQVTREGKNDKRSCEKNGKFN